MLISELIVLKDNHYIGSFFCQRNVVQLIIPKLVGYQCHVSDFNKNTKPSGIKHAGHHVNDNLIFIFITPNNSLFIPGFNKETDIVSYPEFFTLESPLVCLNKIKEYHFLNLVDPQKQELEDKRLLEHDYQLKV